MKTLLVFFWVLSVGHSARALSSITAVPLAFLSTVDGRAFEVKRVLDENSIELSTISGGQMIIGETSIHIQLYGREACFVAKSPASVPGCPVPVVVDVLVNIATFTGTGCGDTYTGEEIHVPAEGVHTFLEVEDYTHVLCKKYFPNAAEATLTVQQYDPLSSQIVVRVYNIEFAQSLN